MIALPDEVICPACLDQRKAGKTCWSCRNRGRVEAWRVCPVCGKWRDMCVCHPAQVVSVTKRQPPIRVERVDEMVAAIEVIDECRPAPVIETPPPNIGGGLGFMGIRSRPPPNPGAGIPHLPRSWKWPRRVFQPSS